MPTRKKSMPDPYSSMKAYIACVEIENTRLKAEAWRRAEGDTARRERTRLVRSGVIVPAFMMRPTPVVKRPDGSWAIGIETFL